MQEKCSENTGPTCRDTEMFDTFLARNGGDMPACHGDRTLFAAAFRVKTSATPGIAPESPESDPVYGLSFCGSFGFFDHVSFSWKTWQRCLDGEWEEWSATWPNAGMTRSGIAFRVPPSVPFISGIGSFFWPTPTANVCRSGGIDRWGGSNARKALKKRLQKLQGLDAQELAEAGSGRTMFTTPTADDAGHRKKPYSQGGEALSFQIGGPVNPEWGEWLMGFPIGWTDVED